MLPWRGVFVLVTAAAILGSSCGSKSPDDKTITTDIQAKLYADALTKPASIAIAVQRGAVTLSGDVSSADVALEAMKIANGTHGVRAVNDQLTINGSSAAAQLPNTATLDNRKRAGPVRRFEPTSATARNAFASCRDAHLPSRRSSPSQQGRTFRLEPLTPSIRHRLTPIKSFALRWTRPLSRRAV